MATFTKIKCLNNTGIETELTVGNTYKIISQSETEYTIQNDLTNVAVYLKTLFNPYYKITALNQLLPSTPTSTDGAYGVDSFGTTYKIISADSTKIRLNSVGESEANTIIIPFSDEFGGVANLLAKIAVFGIEINYTQDVALAFVDRDTFISNYITPNNYRYNETYDGIISITDSTGAYVIANLIGLVLNFS